MDIDQFGYFNFEEAECPLHGECEFQGVICKPKFNSRLSDRELNVMRGYYEQSSEADIAKQMYISVETVRTHKRNAFQRVKVHSLSEFILYAKNNNLFI
ncbi:helix-turn-helix transcriptional regulator [Bacteroides sp. 51]|uniref:helix-turn-helix domain-containing protein n=1 Tax=Bacteroides sp. 51 TaxID=2302938 RepID=UPI002105E6BA|nr:helix-turn-helix transcriptional regulator [Bacteroides sp. 51]